MVCGSGVENSVMSIRRHLQQFFPFYERIQLQNNIRIILFHETVVLVIQIIWFDNSAVFFGVTFVFFFSTPKRSKCIKLNFNMCWWSILIIRTCVIWTLWAWVHELASQVQPYVHLSDLVESRSNVLSFFCAPSAAPIEWIEPGRRHKRMAELRCDDACAMTNRWIA